VCGTILDPRFTIKFFQFAEFSLEGGGEIKSALHSMYDKYINEDVSGNFDNKNEPFGNENEYFAAMGWLRKCSPTNSPDGTVISAAKPKAKQQKKIKSLLSEEENSCNDDNNNDDNDDDNDNDDNDDNDDDNDDNDDNDDDNDDNDDKDDDDNCRNRNGNMCNQNQVPANTRRLRSTCQATELRKKENNQTKTAKSSDRRSSLLSQKSSKKDSAKRDLDNFLHQKVVKYKSNPFSHWDAI
jgi:hypothetical protein